MKNNYWLFYCDNNGYIPMGNDGQMSVPFSTARNFSKLEKLARNWLGKRNGSIFLMSQWTQKMSELGPYAFSVYIQKYGVKIAHS